MLFSEHSIQLQISLGIKLGFHLFHTIQTFFFFNVSRNLMGTPILGADIMDYTPVPNMQVNMVYAYYRCT